MKMKENQQMLIINNNLGVLNVRKENRRIEIPKIRLNLY